MATPLEVSRGTSRKRGEGGGRREDPPLFFLVLKRRINFLRIWVFFQGNFFWVEIPPFKILAAASLVSRDIRRDMKVQKNNDFFM